MSSVAVLGGGLAGMTAAWRLTERRYDVTLVERRGYLGGRAYSFVDRETDQEIDNGQHVFLGCCTAFTGLLRDIGTLDRTRRQTHLRIAVRSPSGRVGVLTGLPLPAPLHLLPSFMRYPHISFADKLRAVPALLKIQRERDRERLELRRQSFHDWLTTNGQPASVIAKFWDLIVLPSLNDVSRDVSATMGIMVFQESLLRDAHGADVGYAHNGLSDAIGSPMAEKLTAAGARLMMGRTVERLAIEDDGRVGTVELAGGEPVHADWYVSALPPTTLLDTLPETLRGHAVFGPAATHTWSPIVNIHVWYDRPIDDFDFIAFIDSPVQWVFNHSAMGSGQHVTVSLSAAWEFWPLSKDELRALFESEMKRLFPNARDATIERFVIVKEQYATFRSLPDGPPNRLPTKTPVPNLVLAGDWTDTGWPATMESAVRSGNNAAAAIDELDRAGTRTGQGAG